MSDVLETVIIQDAKSPKGIKVINASDFDEKAHKKATDADLKKYQDYLAKGNKAAAKTAE